MTVQQWATPGTLTGILTTEMNSNAQAALSTLSAAVDNRTLRAQYIAFRLHLATLTPTGTPSVEVWVFKSLDGGTTYDDGSLASLHCHKVSMGVTTGAGAKEENSDLVLIGPFMFKFATKNMTNVTFPASGNTLEYTLIKEESV